MVTQQESVYDQTIARLKKAGIRITPQRVAIIRFMIQSVAHPTAEMIYTALAPAFPHMSVATIYNNLKLLIDQGLVEEMNVGDVATHYDFALAPHYHAVCTNCGRIVDFVYSGMNDVENVAAGKTGFAVSGHHLEVYGLCPDCQRKLAMTNGGKQAVE